MKKSIIQTLQAIIQGKVLYQENFKKYYSADSSSYQIIPKVIVAPKKEKDVINTIKIAKKFKTSVTARGADAGLVGSALNSEIILDMKNFDSCKIYKNHAIISSGTSKGKLDKKLQAHKKFLPDPSVGSFCSIGEMIGNNLSGSRSLKYGQLISKPCNTSKMTQYQQTQDSSHISIHI